MASTCSSSSSPLPKSPSPSARLAPRNLASISLSRSSLTVPNDSSVGASSSSTTVTMTSNASENDPLPRCCPTSKSVLAYCGILSHFFRSNTDTSADRHSSMYSFARTAATLASSWDDGRSPILSSIALESKKTFGALMSCSLSSDELRESRLPLLLLTMLSLPPLLLVLRLLPALVKLLNIPEFFILRFDILEDMDDLFVILEDMVDLGLVIERSHGTFLMFNS
mmetsp:Transcript_29814/g.48940  ORF Transcript_29814/g.48940 Transcript_29814/m.48940 type:complete len:225 (+) Transcript_29814:434-1108(+)